MNASSKASALLAKILLLIFGLFMVGVFLMKPQVTSSTTRAQERVFENAIPTEVPIKLKIKKEKEKSFKDSKDEKWVREFELEVINTGDKPIFFIYLNLITDVKIGNEPLMFALMFGRAELGNIITKAQPDDPSIKPGETYVFKIHPGQVMAWEKSLRNKSQLDALRIKANLEMLSFGDGTGYFVNKPYPRADKLQSEPGRSNWLTLKSLVLQNSLTPSTIALSVCKNFTFLGRLKGPLDLSISEETHASKV